jgi:hypothetical protein
VATTHNNIYTQSLLSDCLHDRTGVDRLFREAVFSSLYCQHLREVTGLAANFAELLTTAVSICSFMAPSTKKCLMELHI